MLPDFVQEQFPHIFGTFPDPLPTILGSCQNIFFKHIIDIGDVIVSRDQATEDSPLLVTYRFQEPTKRFSVNLRTVEGTPGNVSCFVIPNSQPKIAHLITLDIKPLSLHEKVY